MPGGGLISLVAYGAQNTILSGNPDFTYFYKIYKKYSHFSQESVTIPLEGPNDLSFTNPIQLRVKIQRIGDLLSDMYLTFRIPDIYCKDVTTPDNLYNPGSARVQNASQFNFAWARFLGAHIIRSAAFFVGGQKIQEFDSEYIIAKAFTDLDQDAFLKWQHLVGDVPELNDPANGPYKGYSVNGASGYPLVVKDASLGNSQQNNRPSIFGRDIIVPIPFWFCQSFANSLPLIALQYHDCEVQFTLRSIQELYTILDPNGIRVAPGYRLSSQSDLSGNQPVYIPYSNPDNSVTDAIFNLFAVDFGFSPPSISSWFINPRIQCTFTYLTDDERKVFANQPLSYLLYQTTSYIFNGLYNRQVLDLETHNPVNRLLFVPRRSDTLQFTNATQNYTNWWNWPTAPFLPGATTAPNIISSGTLNTNTQDQILRHLRILMDGNEIQEEKSIDYFTKVVPWRNIRGGSLPEAKYIPIFSFELESPSIQPSGSVNTSRVRVFQVEVDPWPLPQPTLYTYNLSIYVENINWFEVAGGMGGLKWAL